MLIIILSKWFGHAGIMMREDYYEQPLRDAHQGHAARCEDAKWSLAPVAATTGTLRRSTMTSFWLHPSLILIVGALLLPLVPARLKKGYLLLVPLLLFARILSMAHGEFGEVHVPGPGRWSSGGWTGSARSSATS